MYNYNAIQQGEIMNTIYKYERSQRKTATMVSTNIFLIFIFYKLTSMFFTVEKYGTDAIELNYWIGIAAPVTAIILFILALYLWINNKSFSLVLTNKTLSVNDPMFGDFSFEVDIDEIEEIIHRYDAHNSRTRIIIKTKNNKKYYLTQNYRYNRKELYEQIEKLNSDIIMPKSPYKFTRN
jgi:hypothetical protein